jgi:hypothetical protein
LKRRLTRTRDNQDEDNQGAAQMKNLRQYFR